MIVKHPLVVSIFFFSTLIFFVSSHFNNSAQGFVAYGAVSLYLFALFFNFADKIRLLLLLISLFVSWRYIFWRITGTILYTGFLDYIGTLLLLIAELYGIIISSLGIFTSLHLLERKPIDIQNVPIDELPSVDVLIPTYNEDFDIVVDTVLAASMMVYPQHKLRVCILDDGGSDQKINDSDPDKRAVAIERRKRFQEFCTKNEFTYITRAKNLNAKAGNINSALQQLDGELILILDCDHIPTQNFLKNTVGEFLNDSQIFLVQTPHAFYNPDPIEKNMGIFRNAPSENEMFYYHIQKGHDFWESSFFCGSAALLRRSHLDLAGGIAGETITEDAETALKLHAMGYKSAYIAIPMIRGLQPETFSALVLQRVRWSQGMVQIFLLSNPLFKPLKLHQKLSYFSASFFWFFSYARVVYLVAPLAYLLFGLRIYHATPIEILVYPIPHLILSILTSYYLYKEVRWNFYSEVYETALSLFTLPAIFSVFMNPRAPEFAVTPKGENAEEDFISQLYTPFVIIFTLILLGFAMGIYRLITDPELISVTIITMIWNIFNLFLILSALVIVYEKRQLRRYARIPSNETVILNIGFETFYGIISDISMGGIAITFEDQVLRVVIEKLKTDSHCSLLIQEENGRNVFIQGKYLHTFKNSAIFRFNKAESDFNLRRVLLGIIFGQNTKWIEYEKLEVHPTPAGAFLSLLRRIRHELKLMVIFNHTRIQLMQKIYSFIPFLRTKGV
ncbi:UDP-forming cellulose synthase catalytic subunit [Sulfuricurvum sp.]|uniref:UDP-forming cellulose synthase catalytic subunit n=1 Tax=Sulfuricurvum sp. TaxID=2025608 RepID=UPI00262AB6AD|nr:UDP-forming cellulose synthase catalytic subunit [Sulfuricurvum sp.]MDD2266163.1 UDP-forming cellulose synthase catalytic subunit [Sulfuricurvum sp.]MDD2784534.1 UDP-forming cellulose synthase catalytic subunit [Sulfuricurvum sp.]